MKEKQDNPLANSYRNDNVDIFLNSELILFSYFKKILFCY